MAATVTTQDDSPKRTLKPCTGRTTTYPMRDIVRGDMVPSQQPVSWSSSVTERCEFGPFETSPQQDLGKDGMRIQIHKEIDKRGQPWKEVVRANIHDMPVTRLPPLTASPKEVQEWCYLVLCQRKHAAFVDEKAVYVSAAVCMLNLNGKALRNSLSPVTALCPITYTNVDQKNISIPAADRAYIDRVLAETILSLCMEEKKDADRAWRVAGKKVKVDKKGSCPLRNFFKRFTKKKGEKEQLPAYEKMEKLPSYSVKAI